MQIQSSEFTQWTVYVTVREGNAGDSGWPNSWIQASVRLKFTQRWERTLNCNCFSSSSFSVTPCLFFGCTSLWCVRLRVFKLWYVKLIGAHFNTLESVCGPRFGRVRVTDTLSYDEMSELKAGFHWRQSRSRTRKNASTWWKSKIGVVSGVTSSAESELEDSERFLFLPISLMTPIWSSEN